MAIIISEKYNHRKLFEVHCIFMSMKQQTYMPLQVSDKRKLNKLNYSS